MKRLSAVYLDHAFLLIVPVLILVLAFSLRLATGPFWLATNSDPAYLYLMNGLYWLKGVAPYFTDHPGTPLEVLFLVLAVLLNLGKTPVGVIEAVVLRPEFYLGVAYVLLMGLFFASLVFVGWYAYRKTRSRPLALLTQLPAFFYLTLKAYSTSRAVLPIIANINAEPLLISVINVFIVLVIKLFYARDDKEEHWTTLALAVVCGLALSVKFTFGTFWLIPLLLLSGTRRWIFLAVALASFAIWTIPIWPRYGDMGHWLLGLVTRTGFHSSGKVGLVDPGIYFPALGRIIRERAVYFSVTLVLAVTSLMAVYWKRFQDRAWRFLLVISSVAVMHFFVVARQPGVQYMTPALGLGGLLFFFAFLSWPVKAERRHRAAFLFALTIAVVATVQAVQYCQAAAMFTSGVLNFYEKTHKEFASCQFIPYYRATGPEYALHFGDNITNVRVLGDELNRLYPGHFFFQEWNYQVNHFSKVVRISQVAQINPCVLFQGPPYDFSIGPYEVEKIADGPGENLYRLKGSVEDDAIRFYLMAQILENQDRLPEAYLIALRSRSLKFQPSVLLDDVIDRLKKKLESK